MLVRVRTSKMAKAFSLAFFRSSGHEIPAGYILHAKCMASACKNMMHGGFVISDKYHRCIRQIPKDVKFSIPGKYSEITCFFIRNKKYFFEISIGILKAVLSSRSKYFVYSYCSDNRKLEKYYASGNPKRIYSGLVINLENPEIFSEKCENVEYLSKYGILRIFIKRTFLEAISWLRSKSRL